MTNDPKPSLRAVVRFELINKGGKPVRILSVESGCGCAKPVVRPDYVAPGRSATVDVSAIPISVGEKDVPITIRTDSPTKSEVSLNLHIMGTRPPPFLFEFWGDLTFRGDYSPGLSREITVVTVEPPGQGEMSKPFTDLPFLTITEAGIEEQPYKEPGVSLRKRKYRVDFTEKPPAETFTGKVVVEDPWDPGTTLSLNVFGQFRSGLKVVPSTITLARSGGGRASLIVIASEPVERLDVITVEPTNFLLDVQLGHDSTPKRVHKVVIGLGQPSSSAVGQARLKIRQPGSPEEVIVPVTVVER